MALSLLAKIGLDGSGFMLGLRNVDSAVSGFSRRLGSSVKGAIAGAFTVGAVTALTKKTLDYAGQLNDLSARLGVSTDFLQEFRFVAKQTGTDLEALTKHMEKLNSSRDTALKGGKEGDAMLAQFRALGISQKDLKGKRIEDLISGPIATAFEKGDVQGKLGAAWRQVAGKSAGELVASFTDGFNQQRAQARKAGQILSEDAIQQLDAIGDQFAILGDRLLVEWGKTVISMIGWVRQLANVVAQAGAFLGAGTAQMKPDDWLKLIADELTFGWAKTVNEGTGGKPPTGFDEVAAGQAALDVENEFKNRLNAELAARAAGRAARAKSRLPGIVEPVAPAAGPKAGSDALIRVGNFLGSSQTTLSRIGEQTNSLLRQVLQEQKLLRQAFQNSNNDGIQVPG